MLNVAAVSDSNRNFDTPVAILVGPVGEVVRQELRIRYDHRGALEGLNFRCAHGYTSHQSFITGDENPIADLDRPFDQQNQSQDKVIDNILQTKTDSHGKSARDVREIEPKRRNSNSGRNDDSDISESRGDGVLDTGLQLGLRQHSVG